MSKTGIAALALALALSLGGVAGPVRGQYFGPYSGMSGPLENIEGFTVAGKATVMARPNVVEIDLSVSSASELTADAIVKYRDARRKLRDAFTTLKLGNVAVEERGLRVDQKGMMNNPYWFGGFQPNQRNKTEVELSRKLVVRGSDIRKMDEDAVLQLVAKLLDVAQDAGGHVGPQQEDFNPYYYRWNQQNNGLVRFVVEDFEKLQEEAYEKAIADARTRAKRLARLSKVELGPIVAIREIVVPGDVVSSPEEDRPRKRLETSKFQDIPVRVELLVRFEVVTTGNRKGGPRGDDDAYSSCFGSNPGASEPSGLPGLFSFRRRRDRRGLWPGRPDEPRVPARPWGRKGSPAQARHSRDAACRHQGPGFPRFQAGRRRLVDRGRRRGLPGGDDRAVGYDLLAHGNSPTRGRYSKNVQGAVEYLVRCGTATGLITGPTQDSGMPMHGHGFALMFLACVYGMITKESLRKQVQSLIRKAVALTSQGQSGQGGWSYVPGTGDEGSVTVTQVQALRAAHNAGFLVPKSVIEEAVRYLERCRTPEGGIEYSLRSGGGPRLPISAAAVATLYNAGQFDSTIATDCLKFVWDRFRANEGFSKGDQHDYYTHLYAAQGFYMAGDQYWDAYFPKTRDQLIALQQPDGSWPGDFIGPVYGTGVATIILQLPYKYLPVFQR